jgi:alanine racemase
MRSDLIAQINIDNLAHNCRVLRAKCRPGTKICAVLKANAYGHGLSIVAPTLHAAGVDYAAVATLSEALELRSIRWPSPILMLGNMLAVADQRERQERLRAIIKYDLTLTISDVETLRVLARLNPQGPINVHVKVDTGMGRMGVMPDDLAHLLDLVVAAPHLRLVGLYSHFATADFEERELVDRQLRTFHEILARYGDRLPPRSIRHLANSAATLTLPEAHFDMVRPGLAMYGIPPAEWLGRGIDLRPILRLVSHLTAVKMLPPGHCVGYGRTFTTQRSTRLGIVPIGYFDGYVRSLSNAAVVGTNVGDAPVIGRVSMDQIALDLTGLPELHTGDEVVLIDDCPNRPNSVPAIARLMDSIPYEVTCLLGERIERVPVGVGAAQIAPAAKAFRELPAPTPIPARAMQN